MLSRRFQKLKSSPRHSSTGVLVVPIDFRLPSIHQSFLVLDVGLTLRYRATGNSQTCLSLLPSVHSKGRAEGMQATVMSLAVRNVISWGEIGEEMSHISPPAQERALEVECSGRETSLLGSLLFHDHGYSSQLTRRL